MSALPTLSYLERQDTLAESYTVEAPPYVNSTDRAVLLSFTTPSLKNSQIVITGSDTVLYTISTELRAKGDDRTIIRRGAWSKGVNDRNGMESHSTRTLQGTDSSIVAIIQKKQWEFGSDKITFKGGNEMTTMKLKQWLHGEKGKSHDLPAGFNWQNNQYIWSSTGDNKLELCVISCDENTSPLRVFASFRSSYKSTVGGIVTKYSPELAFYSPSASSTKTRTRSDDTLNFLESSDSLPLTDSEYHQGPVLIAEELLDRVIASLVLVGSSLVLHERRHSGICGLPIASAPCWSVK